MKKVLCLLLSIVMVLSLFTACGEGKKPTSDNADGGDAVAENVLTVEKLAAVAADSVNGSLTTASFKVVAEFKGGADEISPDTVAMLKNYGWTAEKIEATLKVSVLSSNDGESGKIDLDILDGNSKEIYGIGLVVTKGDIYLESAAVTDLIDLLAPFAPDMITDDLKTTVKDAIEGKKYIMINLASLESMLMGGVESEDADDTDDIDFLYSYVGINTDEFKKVLESISKEENIVKAAEKAIEDVNLITEAENTLTVKFTDDSIATLIEKITPILKDNATYFGTLFFDAMKNSYVAEEDPNGEFYVDPKEIYTDDFKKDMIDSFANFGEEDEDFADDDESTDIEDSDEADVDISAEIKFTVDDNDSNFFNVASTVTYEDKSDDGAKITVAFDFAVVKSSETVADISASDCIALETLIVKLSSLFESDDDIYGDDALYGDEYIDDSYTDDELVFEF